MRPLGGRDEREGAGALWQLEPLEYHAGLAVVGRVDLQGRAFNDLGGHLDVVKVVAAGRLVDPHALEQDLLAVDVRRTMNPAGGTEQEPRDRGLVVGHGHRLLGGVDALGGESDGHGRELGGERRQVDGRGGKDGIAVLVVSRLDRGAAGAQHNGKHEESS